MALALLVDHDADTRQMYAQFLRQSAYDTEEAENGSEALAKAISRQPTVIVTETRLPSMTGLELCRTLRSDALTRSIPIIVVTGDTFANNVELAEAAGADAVLVKPCLPDRLFMEIRQLVSRAQALDDVPRGLAEPVVSPVEGSGNGTERSESTSRRVALSRAHDRRATSDPPIPPPTLVCPECDRPLTYLVSQIGGVSERYPEQWDYLKCMACRAAFEYRQRTRKLRRFPFGIPAVRTADSER